VQGCRGAGNLIPFIGVRFGGAEGSVVLGVQRSLQFWECRGSVVIQRESELLLVFTVSYF